MQILALLFAGICITSDDTRHPKHVSELSTTHSHAMENTLVVFAASAEKNQWWIAVACHLFRVETTRISHIE